MATDGPYNLWNPPPRPWTSPFEGIDLEELERRLSDIDPEKLAKHDADFEKLLRQFEDIPVTGETLRAWSD